jgi:hypothetical protein
MFVEFWTSNNVRVQILEVQILLNKMALVQCYCFLPTGLHLAKLEMNEEYSQWGNDDSFVKHWICSKIPSLGFPVEGEPKEGETLQPIQYDDSRSVHNESDLAKIQALQEQVTAQEAKLKTITELLFKNNVL